VVVAAGAERFVAVASAFPLTSLERARIAVVGACLIVGSSGITHAVVAGVALRAGHFVALQFARERLVDTCTVDTAVHGAGERVRAARVAALARTTVVDGRIP
jgi:hypothetical protein